MKQIKETRVAVAFSVPEYVDLTLYEEGCIIRITFKVSKEEALWLHSKTKNNHYSIFMNKGLYYFQASYCFGKVGNLRGYAYNLTDVLHNVCPKIKKTMMIAMRRAKQAVLQMEINKLEK